MKDGVTTGVAALFGAPESPLLPDCKTITILVIVMILILTTFYSYLNQSVLKILLDGRMEVNHDVHLLCCVTGGRTQTGKR